MRCSCDKKAIYIRRYSGQRFCGTCFNEYFKNKVWETIRKEKMIGKGDKIVVAISGGKDSTVLLHTLSDIASQMEITLDAVIVDEGIKGYRKQGLEAAENTCNTLGVPLHVVSFEEGIGFTQDSLQKKGDRKPCTYCGVFRRRLLNKKVIELGFDKLAVGHNLDDEAQVVLMNYLNADIERLHRLKGESTNPQLIKRIKPLSKLPEKEVMLYAHLNKLEISTDECPYANENHRTEVRDFLNRLEENRPGIKFSVVRGWERIINSSTNRGTGTRTCSSCGQPSGNDFCRVCELTEEIKIKMSGES
jgi:uncharacterized protein (TIGR00269 family)